MDNITEIMEFVGLNFQIEGNWYNLDMVYNSSTGLYSALIPTYNQLGNETLLFYVVGRTIEGQFIGSDVYIHNVPAWVRADLNRDGKVDMKDIGFAARHFGESDP